MKLIPLVLSGTMLCAGVLQADLIYSNFGSGMTYSTASGLTAGSGAAVPFLDKTAAPQGFDYVLSSITVPVLNQFDSGDVLTIALYSASSGLPGTLLASKTVVPDIGAPELVTAEFTNGPTLSAGNTQYWVALSDPDGSITWESNPDANLTGTAAYSSGWQPAAYTQGAMEVDATQVTPAPEPATFSMFGAGCLALILLVARRSAIAPGSGSGV